MTMKLESTMGMSSSALKLELGAGEARNGRNGGGVIAASGEVGTVGSSNSGSYSGRSRGRTGRCVAMPSAWRRDRSEKFTIADRSDTGDVAVIAAADPEGARSS